MEIPLLQNIMIIFLLSIGVLYLSYMIKIPTVVGFLLTGIVFGPYGFGLIQAQHDVEMLAEIGVIMLLFSIGLEFSFKALARIKKAVFLGGTLEVVIVILTTWLIGYGFGMKSAQAVFMGFLLSLSSTAIVLKHFQEKAEIDSAYGQTSLAILIYQDIIVVPMMLVTPLLAGNEANIGLSLTMLLLKSALIIGLVIIAARHIVPGLLYRIAKTRIRELFLISVCGIFLAVAWVTSNAGLSFGLGAFLAGLIISESEYRFQALGGIIPFRDVFTSFFFVSIGMLLNSSVIFAQPFLISSMVLGILLLKITIVLFICACLSLQFRHALITSFALCQIGEFSFVLSRTGLESKLISQDLYQLFLVVSVLSMIAAPFLISFASLYAENIGRWPFFRLINRRFAQIKMEYKKLSKPLKEHLVIIGYGVNGRLLAQAAKKISLDYIIVDTNIETVKNERSKGEPIIYGDASIEAVAEQAHLNNARILVVGIPDPIGTRRIVQLARNLNPSIHILARSRFVAEIDSLSEAGANEVIAGEYETAIEILSRVLKLYLLPNDEIENYIYNARQNGYKMVRTMNNNIQTGIDIKSYFPDMEIKVFRISQNSSANDKTLTQLQLRSKHGVTVLAIRRDQNLFTNPGSDLRLVPNDLVVVFGSPIKISNAKQLFEGGSK